MDGEKDDKEDAVPEGFTCCITMEMMVDPVVTKYGHSFEREPLENWILLHGTCPLTKQPLGLG